MGRLPWHRSAETSHEPSPGDAHQGIFAGSGRVWQIVGRMMRAKRIGFAAPEDVAPSVGAAETAVRRFPHLKVFARARNRAHAYQLMEPGVAVVWRETLASSLEMAEAVLSGLGLPEYQAETAVATFRRHDEQRLCGAFGMHRDQARMQALARKASEELEELFAQDAAHDGGR